MFYFLYSTCKRSHRVFVFLWLILFSIMPSKSTKFGARGIASFFLWLSHIPFYVFFFFKSIPSIDGHIVKSSESSSLSVVWLFATPWTGACQVVLSLEFSRQEYWSGFPWHFPVDLPDLGFEPRSPAFQAYSLPFELPRNGHTSYFHILTTINNAAMNIGMHESFWISFFFFKFEWNLQVLQ